MNISRKAILLFFDLFCFAATCAVYYFLVLQLGKIEPTKPTVYLTNCVILFFAMLVFRLLFKIYLSVWRYAGTGVYAKILISDALGGALTVLVTLLCTTYTSFWDLLIPASIDRKSVV